MSWFYLMTAIIFEVIGTVSMKFSNGFKNIMPSIMAFLFYGLCLTCLTFALKKIDVSIAYAIWSGLGTVLVATIGILWFRESVTVLKLISIGLITLGVIGLNIPGKI